MKVDASKLKKSSSELSIECRQLIQSISKCQTKASLLEFLSTINVWIYGKCELFHWIEILDRFDKILEDAAKYVNGNEYLLNCDSNYNEEDINLLILVLNFTTLLIEHSFSRHLYNSVEHLTKLLSSQNMCVVLAVLNLLYMFSKRSNFIPRLQFERKEMLLIKLLNIAERWGDPNYGLSLYDCCMREPKIEFLYQLSVDYIDENGMQSLLEIPDMMDVCKKTPPSEVYKNICTQISNPSDAIKMRIAHRIRLVCGFKDLNLRLKFVQARLQAVSILIYSNAIQENLDKVLYPGFGEELCELIDKKEPHLLEIRAAVLRTLTSMLHFDRNPNIPRPGTRLTKIIQYTGADRMGGILPLLVKDCISNLTKESTCFSYPLMLATSLFSLLYHLASYEAGGQALVKSGMMQSLLSVISWSGVDLEHITFVTRAVRVIDLITNIDIAKFHQNNGLNIFIDRLEKEINICRKSLSESKSTENLCSNEYQDKMDDVPEYDNAIDNMGDEIPEKQLDGGANSSSSSSNNPTEGGETVVPECSKSSIATQSDTQSCSSQQGKVACLTQRAALLKSMLNFLKKSIQDHTHFNGMRNIMETSLPSSLRHIISNAEYYGPSLFLLATDVVTVYVFNEPSLLSSLQDLGLTKVMLQSLLQKDVPATREVLGSLPNVFSALCLNERGLMEFMSYKPFDKLLKVLLSSDYLVAMRRRRSSDPLGDTATNLGNAMDDLMKHHPYLRSDAIEAIVRLLNELVRLGTDSSFICWRSNKDSAAAQNAQNSNTNNDNIARDALIENTHNDSSEEDDDDEDEISSASQQQQRQNPAIEAQSMQVLTKVVEREPIPLIDFILNVMKFVEAIFNNSSNGNNDHCREFVLHGGLKPLLQLLSLPNLPVDSPVSTTAQAVANVCKSIFNIAHETKVIDMALQHLSKIVENLEPLIHNPNFADGSILLREFVCCPKLEDGFSNAEYTPLLHRMSSVHGYVIMLVHLCRNASNEMRSVLLKRWGTNAQNGLQLLKSLVQLYISLVWESTILLSLCSDEQNHEQLWEDIINKSMMELKNETTGSSKALEKHLAKIKITPEEQTRYVKSLLAASSRLGRALAELFGTLVKLAVGTPQPKQRRTNDFQWPMGSSKYPTPDAKEIAKVLSSILVCGFKHENAFPNPPPKLKLTFLICSVGFTVPMLFDDKRNSFHLMISQFCEENGLQAFFDMFFWAISLDGSNSDFSFEKCLRNENILEESEEDSNDYPEGTGEFLDAWLQLLEKMVNPRATLESPYAIGSKFPNQPDKTNIQFEPVFYLVQVHQLAMQCIRRIWTKKPIPGYGVSMTESIISILKHLIKSYSNLKSRYNARVTELNNKSQDQAQKSVQTSPNELSVNPEYLKILTDMGFVRFHVIDALLNTRSLEQATEYLLNNPESSVINQQEETNMSVTNSTTDSSNEMDVDLQNLRKDSESNSISSPEQQEPTIFKNISLISDEVFEEFCEDSLEKILILMEYLPEAVTPGTELISIIYRRQNSLNKNSFVKNLIKHNTNMVQEILMSANTNDCKPDDPADIFYGIHSKELYIRLKVTNILFHEVYSDIRKEICNALVWERCIEMYLSLLKQTEELLNKQLISGMKPVVPSWLHPLIEFIDSIDNVSYIIQRRSNMRNVCSDNWKWFDSSTGKWNSYSETHNQVLKNAFNFGERSVSLSNGRQRYTVNFNSMTQVNEASGSHRIILPSLKITEAIGAYSNGTPKYDSIVTRIFRNKLDPNDGGEFEEECVNLDTLMKNKVEANEGSAAAGTAEPSTSSSQAQQPSTSKTTEPGAAAPGASAAATPAAAEEGSVSMKLFHFPQRARAMEEAAIVVAAVAARVAKKNSESKGNQAKRMQDVVISEEPVGLSSYDTKSIVASLTRLLNPNLQLSGEIKVSILRLCARLTRDYKNAKAFYKNGGLRMLLDMQQTCNAMGFPIHAIVIIRHLLESPSILQEAIERVLTMRATPHIPVGHRDITFMLMQVSSAVSRNPAIFFDAAKHVLKADHVVKPTFLNEDYRLIVRPQPSRKHLGSSSKSKQIESLQMAKDTIKDLLLAVVRPCVHYGGISYTDEQANPEEKVADKIEPSCCSWHIPSTAHTHLKPILPRATILKLLADTVRSYQTLVPQLIVEHVYTPQHSVLIQKEQTFLSFVLDNFLPIITRQQDAEVSLMSRVLIISLSDCYTNSTVQSKVVEEIQDAIKRALLKTDSTEKHTRLQVLVGLLPAMIESPLLNNKVQMQRNNMYRILLKHDIMTYLAKLAQYKDLSNYNSLQTINAILRPMEILLRVTTGPANMASKRIFFGSGSQGSLTRRIYPRLLARSHDPGSGVGNEHVLRDMIRNVLTDRRPTFDFVFTPEDMFMDLDDAVATSSRSTTNNLGDNRLDSNDSNAPSGNRPQLNFERLWDDLLQSEEIRLTTMAPGSSSTVSHNNGDHLSAAHDDVSRNNDNSGGGGSDGASTSSETGPTVPENSTSLLGDVSTSESDSDSNISTENDERNDDDEEEENDEEANDDDDVEDRSETDGDEETRQYIEVFDDIFEPGSSETASNDADVDGEDNTSEMGGAVGLQNIPTNSEIGVNENSSSSHRPTHEDVATEVAMMNDRPTLSEGGTSSSMDPSFNVILSNHVNDNATPSSSLGSVNTTPVSQWVPSRLTFGVDGHISFSSNADVTSVNEPANINSENEPPAHNTTDANGHQNALCQRRDGTRRLVFLDQQYCVPMPSFSCPTEESQIELFNQDALHWWFEESKNLELESQGDACLYVAHRLIPFLIGEIKEVAVKDSKYKKSETSVQNNSAAANSRRSAIPVLIPHPPGSNIPANIGPDNEETQPAPPNPADVANALIVEETTEFIPPTTNENSVDSPPEFADNNVAASGSAHLDSVPEVEDNFVANEEDATNECSEFSDDQPEAPQNDDEATTTAPEAQDVRTAEEDEEDGNEEEDEEDDEDEGDEEEDEDDTEESASKDLTVEEAAPPAELDEEGAVGGAETPASTSATDTLASPEEIGEASGVTPAAGASAVEVNPEIRAALGDLEVPDGVDPSFLAALPLEMREEVIQEHLRMQRIRQRSQQATLQVTNEPVLEVNPEFLAALPPNLQSEVLLQQRLEQQRQAAQTANPEDPVDTAAFFQNLPDALRQVILTDMEDSQIATLPPDLAAEAQFLRRDWETRNGSRIGNFRFPSALHNFGDDSRWHSNSIWYDAGASAHTHQQAAMFHPGQQHHGKPTALVLMEDSNNLLDPDSIATLLLFLCIEDSKMNFGRLHRVIRNLCYHLPTREWIINALMNIIQKTNEDQLEYKLNNDIKPQWLKMYVDAAFGYKANVFVINKKEHGPGYSISINPQAAQMIVRNCLEMLFFLAKNFAKSFLPYNKEKEKEKELKNRGKPSEANIGGSSSDTIDPIPLSLTLTHGEQENGFSREELRAAFYRQNQLASRGSQEPYRIDDLICNDLPTPSKSSSRSSSSKNTNKNRNLKYNTNSRNFWDVLLNIDLSTNARLSNIQQFPLMCHPAWEWKPKNQDFIAFNESPFATLLEMLPYKVICRSPNLTDSLVKLLASLSGDLPKEEEDPPPTTETELTGENLSQNETKDGEATASTSTAANTAPVEAGTSKHTTSSSSSSVPGPVLSASSLLTKNKAAVPETVRKRRMYSKNFSHLQLIIEVLTHQCGTTEGLEYVSKLIINLSLCSQAFNAILLEYLTSAINGLACDVQNRIQTLLSEILIYNEKNEKPGTSTTSAAKNTPVYVSQSNQLVMEDRFTSSSVIISAPKHAKPACELQLPAMKTLLSPASAQLYFLRTLKIFIQIRSIFQTQNKDNAANTPPTPTLSQIICLDGLWDTLSACLKALEDSKDEYAVLVLQPTVEAFFLIHANSKSKDPKYPNNSNTNSTLDENNLNLSGEEAQANAGGEGDVAATAEPQAEAAEHIPGPDIATLESPIVSDLNAENTSDSNSDIRGDGSPTDDQLKLDRLKFLNFAEKHRTVLNQILRQSNTHLSDGPFAVLVDHTRILDFDVKRKYFQTELERIDEGVRREEHTVSVRRVTVFEDSFRVLYRLGREEWKNRFYIVFEEEEGQDAGGLLREWYVIISREIFNPMYALFCVSPGDRVTYMINPSSHANPNHLSYFKFVGRVIAKAIHDNKLLECYFTRSFYKHILGKQVKYTDMESQDYEFYKGLDYLMKNDISTLGYELTFSTEVQEFGVTQVRDLIPNGRNIPVTEENKFEYVNLVCQLKMSGSIRQQLDAFLEGFYDIIPKHLISIFNEQELELLISGLPDIDIEDLKANTEYHKYTSKSSQIQWFWRALRSFDQADRAKFLQFVTGTSKVPLQGFGSLEGMNGIQKFQIHRDDRSTDRLPCAHTCFNQLDLPMYKSYEKLRSCLLKAIHECSEGFGFA